MPNPQSRSRQRDRKPRVTQDELAEIFAHRRAAKRYDELRKDVVERLKNGAVIESGDFVVELSYKKSKRITFDHLVYMLGELDARRVRDAIIAVPHAHLIVTPQRNMVIAHS